MWSPRLLGRTAVSSLLVGGGLVALAVALFADRITPGSNTGVGATQLLLAIAAGTCIVAGILAASPAGVWLLQEDEEEAGDEEHVTRIWVLWLAIWCGLALGLPELTTVLLQKILAHRFLGMSPHAAWMTPIPYVVTFLIAGAILIALDGLGLSSALKARTVVFVYGFLGLCGLLTLFHPPLHLVAIVLLAAGLSAQAAKLVHRRHQRFHKLVRVSTVPLVLIALVAGLSVPLIQARAESRAVATLTSEATGPNVLLIILDTVRAASLSVYDNERPTSPFLQRLASRGVVFDNAFSTAPWTLPSHASVFTGYWAHEVSADWDTPLDGQRPTLAERLRESGYNTAGFVGNRLYAGPHSGLGRGFIVYDADLISTGEVLASTSFGRLLGEWLWRRRIAGFEDKLGRKHAATVTREFLGWLDDSGNQPFFVFLNFYDAHDPYVPSVTSTKRFGRTGSKCGPDDISAGSPKTEAQLVPCLDAYEASIADLDAHVGWLISELQDRGTLDNTLVIVSSDHGEEFGEHGLASHGRSLYLPALHVPLIIAFPDRVPAAVRVSESVSLRDIPATVMDLLGLEARDQFPGESLARFWKEPPVQDESDDVSAPVETLIAETSGRTWLAEHNPVSRGDMQSLIAQGMHYIVDGERSEELYDIELDPWERINLVHEPDQSHMLAWFRNRMSQSSARPGTQ